MRGNWLRWLAYKYLAVVCWICDQYGNSRAGINDSEPPCSIILTWPTQGDIAKYNERAWGELSNDIKTKRLSTYNIDLNMYKEDFKTIWTAISSISLASEFIIFQGCYGRATRELEHTVATYSAGAGVMEDYRPIWDPVKPFLDWGLKLSKAGIGRLLRGAAQINKKRGSREPRTGSEATRPHAKVIDAVIAYDKDLKADLDKYKCKNKKLILWESIRHDTYNISMKLAEVNNIVEYQRQLRRHGFDIPEVDTWRIEQLGLEYSVSYAQDRRLKDRQIQWRCHLLNQRSSNPIFEGDTECALNAYAYAPEADWRSRSSTRVEPALAHIMNTQIPYTPQEAFPF